MRKKLKEIEEETSNLRAQFEIEESEEGENSIRSYHMLSRANKLHMCVYTYIYL